MAQVKKKDRYFKKEIDVVRIVVDEGTAKKKRDKQKKEIQSSVQKNKKIK